VRASPVDLTPIEQGPTRPRRTRRQVSRGRRAWSEDGLAMMK